MAVPRIRRADRSDAGRLAALRRAYGAERRTVEPDADPEFELRFDEWCARTEDWCHSWLAIVDAESVGLLSMFVIPRMPIPGRDAGRPAYLGLLFVLPEHRRAGFGHGLLEAAFGYARADGVTKILLRSTERAVGLYRRAGFEPADRYLVWSSD